MRLQLRRAGLFVKRKWLPQWQRAVVLVGWCAALAGSIKLGGQAARLDCCPLTEKDSSSRSGPVPVAVPGQVWRGGVAAVAGPWQRPKGPQNNDSQQTRSNLLCPLIRSLVTESRESTPNTTTKGIVAGHDIKAGSINVVIK